MTPGEPLLRVDWVASHVPDIVQRTISHLELTAIAIVVGFVISFVLSLLALRRSGVYGPITWIAGVLYTIPSLALFAVLVPLSGLSTLTAEIGLVSYTLLILIRGIVGGVRGVPSEVREAALGMGYAPNRMLLEVELPLASGVILSALRVATVTTIGLVTVTALIGQQSLGSFILDGILHLFPTPLVVGSLLSIALAILADAGILFLQRCLTPWTQ